MKITAEFTELNTDDDTDYALIELTPAQLAALEAGAKIGISLNMGEYIVILQKSAGPKPTPEAAPPQNQS